MKYLYLLFGLFLLSCSTRESEEEVTTETLIETDSISEEEKIFVEEYFFEFDHITHFSRSKEDGSTYTIFEKDDLSPLEIFYKSVLSNYTHNDTTYLDSLPLIGFTESTIEPSLYPEINELFKSRYVEQYESSACKAVFRDIFVFRKNSKIVGVAKICFGCDRQSIWGAAIPTKSFGQNGEIYDLETMLKEVTVAINE